MAVLWRKLTSEHDYLDENNEQTGTWSACCHRENYPPTNFRQDVLYFSSIEESPAHISAYEQKPGSFFGDLLNIVSMSQLVRYTMYTFQLYWLRRAKTIYSVPICYNCNTRLPISWWKSHVIKQYLRVKFLFLFFSISNSAVVFKTSRRSDTSLCLF